MKQDGAPVPTASVPAVSNPLAGVLAASSPAEGMGQAMQMAMPKVEANVKRAEALPFENEPPFDESLVLLDWCKFILVLILYHVIMSPAL